MKNVVTLIQIILSIALVVLIVIQTKGGGIAGNSSAKFARRGLEKVIYRVTFILAFLFILISITNLFV